MNHLIALTNDEFPQVADDAAAALDEMALCMNDDFSVLVRTEFQQQAEKFQSAMHSVDDEKRLDAIRLLSGYWRLCRSGAWVIVRPHLEALFSALLFMLRPDASLLHIISDRSLGNEGLLALTAPISASAPVWPEKSFANFRLEAIETALMSLIHAVIESDAAEDVIEQALNALSESEPSGQVAAVLLLRHILAASTYIIYFIFMFITL